MLCHDACWRLHTHMVGQSMKPERKHLFSELQRKVRQKPRNHSRVSEYKFTERDEGCLRASAVILETFAVIFYPSMCQLAALC